MKTSTEPDFERLTAFALNELDATERASIEAQLKNDPAAQAYVNDVRATASTLESELKQERLEDLARTFSPASKVAPVVAVAPREVVKPRSNLFAYCASAAAMVMLGVVIWQGYQPDRPMAQKSSVALPEEARLKDKKNADPVVTPAPVTVSEPKAKAPEGLKPVPELPQLDAVKTPPASNSLPVEGSRSADAKKVHDEFPHGLYPKTYSELEGKKNRNGRRTIDIDKNIENMAAVGDHFETINLNGPTAKPSTPLANEAQKKVAEAPKEKEKDVAAKDPVIRMLTNPDNKPDDKKEHASFKDNVEVKKPAKPIEEPANADESRGGFGTRDGSGRNSIDEGKKVPVEGLVQNAPPVSKPASDAQLFATGGGPGLIRGAEVKENSPSLAPHETGNFANAQKPIGIGFARGKDDETAAKTTPPDNYYIEGHNAKIQNNESAPLANTPPPAAPKAIDPVKPPVLLTHPRLDPDFPVVEKKGKTTFNKGDADDMKMGSKEKAEVLLTQEAEKTRARKESEAEYALAEKLRGNRLITAMSSELPVKTPAPAGKPNNFSVSEFEEMKAELAKLREQYARGTAVPGLVDKALDNKYGPDSLPASITIPPGFERYIPPTQPGGETYAIYPENAFKSVRREPLSTFSADVDTASYSNVRRYLTNNQLPPVDAVRVEEMLNYFKYNVDTLKTEGPFGVNVEGAACPWNASTRLVRVAIKASEMPNAQRPASNLVFLIDVSGSMDDPKRLPLVKEGMKSLVKRLNANDRVAIVTYAGESGVALSPTSGAEHDRIIAVIDSLRASGGTNGGAGIQLAYASARGTYIKGGVNRIILATDGDFNMGMTSTDQLVQFVSSQTPAGVYLTALGYGMGNLKDEMLQRLADKGNGNYAYIDNAEESRKVLIEQMSSTLVTVGKDVKFQVEFNPSQAAGYRLIGYEKRAMAAADFNNDAKDAGEVGAGHTVTAFYEVVPANSAQPGVDPLKYQTGNVNVETKPEPVGASPELLTLKIRFKQPDANESKRLEFAFTDKGASFEQATTDFKFASAVALFGQILKYSNNVQSPYLRRVIDIADENRGTDEGGYRREFIQLARKAAELRGER